LSATQFEPDLRDINFVLFDQIDIQHCLGEIPKYADFDEEIYRATIEEGARIATEVLAPLNGPSDRAGCQFDGEGNVTTPKGFQDAWNTVAEGGWVAPAADPEFGGVGLPPVISMAVYELFTAACMTFQMYPGLTAAAGRMVQKFAPEALRQPYAEKLFTGQWGGTMALTEAGAGSSVGDNRCKATRTDEPGVYLLEGEKLFISNADQDLTENIIHLILARAPDAPEGIKGLSLFMCPKYLADVEGNLGERNGAFVVGIEEKMGIHGSATCTLALGADTPCKAWIVGEEGQGIRIMFHMMNEARIGVGIQGMALGAAAYNYSNAYANERIQGTSLRNLKDPNAPRVAIVTHPDVRRMLMSMKVQVETMRSLCYRLAHRETMAECAEDDAERQRLNNTVDLVVPVLKAHCSDIGFEVTVTAVQVYGGYGYIGEYPVEQLLRDSKITSIYEGTNGIQALDLLGRKMRIQGGALFMQWMQEAQEEIAAGTEAGFAEEAAILGKSIQSVGGAAMHLGGVAMQGSIEAAMQHATPFQRMFGTVLLGMEALHQAVAAKRLIDAQGESDFLAGKLLNLKFYVSNILPQAIALGKGIQSNDVSCLDERLFR